jgi:hypothetical protein
MVKIETFSQLMRRAIDISNTMKKGGKRARQQDDFTDVFVVDNCEKNKRYKNAAPLSSYTKRMEEEVPVLPISGPTIIQLVENWLKEGIMRPRIDKPALIVAQQANPPYCLLYRTKGHPTEQCWVIRKVFQQL